MTQEEKARAYDKAIEKIKYVMEHGVSPTLNKEDLQDIFPELKESEDEKVRKALLNAMSDYTPHSIVCDGVRADKIIAWLEKQGEKKPVDKVEPKFKVGDWCIDDEDDTVFQIVKVLDKTYTCETNKGIAYTRTHYSLENDARLWTIQDAKDGDVLVNGSNIFIFHFINDTRLMGYCNVNTDNGRFYDDIGKNECFCLIDAVVNPATKEQCDLLFQKMKEAGYEWDEEKKELRKMEQKPKWSEEDKIKLDGILAIVEEWRDNLSKKELEYYSDHGYVDWLESLKQRMEENNE